MSEADTPKKILLVADYGANDLAFAEVRQKLHEQAAEKDLKIQVDIVSTKDPFNTEQAAALIAKGAESGNYDMVYHNIAPRRDIAKARNGNRGEGLAFAKIYAKQGKEVHIIGVDSADENNISTFSFMKPLSGIYKVPFDEDRKTQFRSRDSFVEKVIELLSGETVGSEKLEGRPIIKPSREVNSWAEKALKNIQTVSPAVHGDTYRDYVTVIAPEGKTQEAVSEISELYATSEVDSVALKSSNLQSKEMEAGFAAAQLALNSTIKSPRTRVIYALTDAFDGNDTLLEMTLKNGVVIKTNNPKTLTFVSNQVKEAIGFEAENWENVVRLPEKPSVAYIDGYGNMKLTHSHHEIMKNIYEQAQAEGLTITEGQQITVNVKVGDKNHELMLTAGGSFSVADGEFALSKGSSGWEGNQGFAELFLRGGNAAKTFDHPEPGQEVEISFKEIKRTSPGTAVVDTEARRSLKEVKGASI